MTEREVVLYIAMSLDGYIADTQGSVSWLGGDNSDSENMGSYMEFYETIDTVIMGYATYKQIITELSPDKWVYEGKKCYILTHRKIDSTEDIIFTDQPMDVLVGELKRETGKNIWICGGANIAAQFMEYDLIDSYAISIIPIILGNGISLFPKSDKSIPLKLISTRSYNGVTDLVYRRRQ